MIGRKDFHSQGKDMVFIESEEDIVPMDYYIEYVPIKKERRYHVVKGNVIAASYKYGGETEGKGEYCRNFKTGWRFSEYKPEPKLATVAKKAVDALGLDFGAVDLIIGEDNKIYVLEVNTAPGLIEKRAECYAEAFRGNYPKVDYDSSILDQMNEDEENGYDPLEAYHGSRTQGPRMFRIYRTTYEFADIEAEDMEDANRIRDDIRDGEDDASWEFSDEDYTALEEI
jgi:hypothetical protein